MVGRCRHEHHARADETIRAVDVLAFLGSNEGPNQLASPGGVGHG
jgi:hypothetical protein